MKDKIIEVAESTFLTDPGVITFETKNTDIEEWDSLGSVFFITALESKFNIKIETSEALSINSIQSAYEIIKERI